jgi:hypothetical protein
MLQSPSCKVDSSIETHEREVGPMTCQKCNGLMVKEWRPEFSQGAAVLRCINCGLVLDPLIAQNRMSLLGAKQRVLKAA